MRVTTYQSPSGATIHLTADQVAELERWGVWPRDGQGEEYATVSHSEHAGTPTYSGAELARFVCNEVERLTAIQRTLVTSEGVSSAITKFPPNEATIRLPAEHLAALDKIEAQRPRDEFATLDGAVCWAAVHLAEKLKGEGVSAPEANRSAVRLAAAYYEELSAEVAS